MRFVNQKAEIIDFPYEKDSYLKMIELVGRVCWHSEDKMTPTSYIKFCEKMVHSNHGSVSEHGTIYLKVICDISAVGGNTSELVWRYKNNRFSTVKDDGGMDLRGYYITTNYRVITENGWEDDLKYACEITPYHERRVTVKFSMDRIGSQSIERHRGYEGGNSFLQESTRYCNYTRDKFGNEIKITPPEWVLNEPDAIMLEAYEELPDKIDQLRKYCKLISNNDEEKFTAIDWWLYANMSCEFAYLNIVKLGHTAQEARAILPVDLNSELFCTFSIPDWKHFFDLRVKGVTGPPHPDIKALCEPLYAEFIRLGYITE